jgi:hypothetical protein
MEPRCLCSPPASRGPIPRAILLGFLLASDPDTAGAAPQPVSTTLQVEMSASIGNYLNGENLVHTIDEQTFVYPSEPVALSGEAVSTEGAGYSRAYETVSAVFTPLQGSVTFEAGVEFLNPDAVSAGAQVTPGHTPWSYTFVPDADGVLTFVYTDYDQTAGNLWFVSSGNPGVYLLGTGSIQRGLLAGQPFTIGLDLFAGPSCFGSCGGTYGGAATFTWTIVPEPSTLAQLSCGTLALALGRRARRRRSTRNARLGDTPSRAAAPTSA